MGNSLPADEITVRTENTTTSERSNVYRKAQHIKFTTSERSNICRKVQSIEITTSERSNVCRKVQHIEITTSERSNVCRKVQHIEITTSERSNVCLVVITLTMDAQYVSAVSVDGRLGTTDRTEIQRTLPCIFLHLHSKREIPAIAYHIRLEGIGAGGAGLFIAQHYAHIAEAVFEFVHLVAQPAGACIGRGECATLCAPLCHTYSIALP